MDTFPLNAAICSSPCGTNKQCTAPDTCTRVSGWKGSDCLLRMVTFSCGQIIVSSQQAICSSTCGTNKQCTGPNTCTCVSGWKGSNC